MGEQKCSRNGCARTTDVQVLRKIGGHYYNISVCRKHLDNLAEDTPIGYEGADE